jgi:hypothetical protein
MNTPRGQETISHPSPDGAIELAIRPASFPGHPEIYSKKDVGTEKELAEIDFYDGKTREGLDIVLIPKTYSTSPGINVHAVKLPAGVSHLSYAGAHAAKSHSSDDKIIAKYKQTIPTHFTYSPSILGYYHLSGFLIPDTSSLLSSGRWTWLRTNLWLIWARQRQSDRTTENNGRS